MTKSKIAAVSLHTTPLDVFGNFETIRSAIFSKDAQDADIILFPELCISGYGCEDAFYRPKLWEKSFQVLNQIKDLSPNQVIVVGLPVFSNSFLYNCMAVLFDGKIQALVPKLNLANTGVHYEKRWFHAPNEFQTKQIPFAGELIPFGHFVFSFRNFRFAIEICEDSWSSIKPSQIYNVKGTDVILSPGASHFAMGKQNIRRQIFKETSRNQNNLQVFTNLCGNESGRIIFEGGAFFASGGMIVKEGPRLHFTPFEITSHNFDPNEIRASKARNFREPNPNLIPNEIPIIVLKPVLDQEANGKFRLKVEDKRETGNSQVMENTESLSPFEEFTKAVSLGLYDYLRKSNTKGYTLSLSGGADSATCALLVSAMAEIARNENGKDCFQKLGIIEKNLLVTLYQKTKNNSQITEEIAKSLSEELDCEFHSISIDEMVSSSVSLIETIKGTKLNWQEHDLALQNIQARVRSPLIWLLANLNGHLLLSTGNRSEAAVGYTTMDGDSSGSIAPLAGVSKEFLLDWLDDIQKGNNRYITPKHSIQLLRETKPTAELKPLAEHQEDEKDLMPYPILNSIERKLVYLGDLESEVLEGLKTEFPWETKEQLLGYIQKFKKLFGISQWKRERLPPSFHLDEYGLDPKSSYRFPILSNET
ncbi:NAD+ synthetase [Leptospira yanagawae serovar Saopaulo str. Sao Paulo = ATCC 700523]|uniref:Glutamine-dependent NAD(+) synthetase n=1 Tax=Leptospira yanagawae serovar Saopaulo str. Sao Paulo = ATCC 700523 TaxID=1249483 RepID=A0A5E8H9N6_9LEPT|nr:NAD(+) synthase [Leptospira yanagawae]EOQ87457.1 NAD+ synthetase [Leptospira yanagawae serovar Saopaulo str. Sao Paulo = ATCC 700523]